MLLILLLFIFASVEKNFNKNGDLFRNVSENSLPKIIEKIINILLLGKNFNACSNRIKSTECFNVLTYIIVLSCLHIRYFKKD